MADEKELKASPARDNGWMVGLIFIGIGLVFLVGNFTSLHLNNWWALFILIPLLSALLNAWRAYQAEGSLTPQARNALVASLFPTFVAVIFLFNLDWGRVWPGFLILGGLTMLLRA